MLKHKPPQNKIYFFKKDIYKHRIKVLSTLINNKKLEEINLQKKRFIIENVTASSKRGYIMTLSQDQRKREERVFRIILQSPWLTSHTHSTLLSKVSFLLKTPQEGMLPFLCIYLEKEVKRAEADA